MKLNHLIITAIFLVISPAISLAERIEYPNGDVYEGETLENTPRGFGVYTWANQDQYIGDFYEGKKSGFGVFIRKEGCEIYQGTWANNKKNGGGVYFGKMLEINRCQTFMGTWKDSTFLKRTDFPERHMYWVRLNRWLSKVKLLNITVTSPTSGTAKKFLDR